MGTTTTTDQWSLQLSREALLKTNSPFSCFMASKLDASRRMVLSCPLFVSVSSSNFLKLRSFSITVDGCVNNENWPSVKTKRKFCSLYHFNRCVRYFTWNSASSFELSVELVFTLSENQKAMLCNFQSDSYHTKCPAKDSILQKAWTDCKIRFFDCLTTSQQNDDTWNSRAS